MKKRFNRIISFALCFVILVGFVPCLDLQTQAHNMYAFVGDSYEYKAPEDIRYDSYWVDEWEISDPSMVLQKGLNFTFLKPGTVTIQAHYKANNYDEPGGKYYYFSGEKCTIIVESLKEISVPVEVYHDTPFCGGGIFPQINAGPDANFIVTEANIYKTMCDYYPGDRLPDYKAGTELLCTINIKAKEGYVFPDIDGEQKCLVNGKEAKIYYNGEKANIYYDVVLEAGSIGPIHLRDLTLPTHGATTDKTCTVNSECTIVSLKYTLDGKEQNYFSVGDEIEIAVRVKCDANNCFIEGSTGFVLSADSDILLRSEPSTLISDHEAVYVFKYTVTAAESQYINEFDLSITPPEAGKTPATTAKSLNPDSNVLRVMWTPGEKTFQAGKSYTVVIEVAADRYHIISAGDLTATVNGETAAAKTMIGDDGKAHTYVNYTFPALPKPIDVVFTTDSEAKAGKTVSVDLEAMAEEDDALMEAYFDGDITVEWYLGGSKVTKNVSGDFGETIALGSGDVGKKLYAKLIYGSKTLTSKSLTVEAGAVPEKPYVFPFIDVAENAWFYQWIKGAHQMGLINGKTATTYCPKDNMTYAEAIKLAACMHQLYHEGEVTLQNGKPDWRTSYYDYCLNNGIIRAAATAMEPGYADLFALASTPIDRQTYVYIFSRALPAEAFKEINNIPDNSIPDVAVTQGIWDDGIYLFYRAGILNGTDAKGTFKPEGNIQRSEVAAILNRMMDESVRVGAPSQLGK